MKYKEMLKKKGSKESDGASISGKSDQAGVAEQADEDPCDGLTAQSGKGKYLMLGYLTQDAHTHVPKKGMVRYLQAL